MRHLPLAIILTVLAWAVPAGAADIAGGYYAPACLVSSQSQLPYTENIADLRQEVTRRYDESVEAADAQKYIHSSRPVFVWASEAKVACGKAIGYLDGGYVSEDYVGKCDCFHRRMVSYMR